MTKNGRPFSVVPPSSTLAMFGWSIKARAWHPPRIAIGPVFESIPALISFKATCAERAGTVGHPDRSHPPLADLFEEL